jgi:hypothetical protein
MSVRRADHPFVSYAAARLSAAVISLAAIVGEVLFFEDNRAALGGSAIATLWAIAAYLTDWSNIGAALVFAGVALGVRPLSTARVVGVPVVVLTTVGTGYAVLGGWEGLLQKPLDDILTHAVTPWLSLAFWLLFVRPGRVGLRDAAVWTAPLVVYWVYAFARGGLTGEYAYPFIDVPKVGWLAAFSIAGGMTALATVIALTLVGLDRLRSPR